MKTKLIIIVSLIVGIAIIGSYFIYFVSGVSASYSPIKQYEYNGSFNQLMSGIQNFAATDSNLNVKITDKTGSDKNGYATYVVITLKSNASDIEYSIKCEEASSKASIKTTVSLVEAYNKTQKTGGYSKEAEGIKVLVNNFQVYFISPLSKTQDIKITPLQ